MKKTTNQYCLDILHLDVRHNKALVNLVMALASHKSNSVVELSESPVYNYQYSSIQDAITHLSPDEATLLELEQRILKLLLNDYWSTIEGEVVFQTDKTVVPKAHSKVLQNRLLIPIPNQKVPGSKSLDIGLEYSFVNMAADKGRWSLPLSGRNIPLDKSASEIAVHQIVFLVTCEDLPFHRLNRVINTLDNGYATPTYLEGTKHLGNVISIVRLRKGSKVYLPASQEEKKRGMVLRFMVNASIWV